MKQTNEKILNFAKGMPPEPVRIILNVNRNKAGEVEVVKSSILPYFKTDIVLIREVIGTDDTDFFKTFDTSEIVESERKRLTGQKATPDQQKILKPTVRTDGDGNAIFNLYTIEKNR